MPTLITNGVSALLTTMGSVFTAITHVDSTSGLGIGQYFVLGIAASAVLLGIKIVRKVVWGA